jgi:nitrite reductase/ring-hydroxylating ferredoxin subunit
VSAVTVGDVDVVLARVDGRICAIAATCSHLGGPLAWGERRDNDIVCPWHGSRFDLCTGDVVNGPAVYPQPVYDIKVEDGRVSIRPKKNG